MMEKKGRHDAGPSPTSSKPSGQAHKATPRPSPPGPSKADLEALNLAHPPNRRWCPICVGAKGRIVPTPPLLTDCQPFRWTSPSWGHRDNSVTLFTAIDIWTHIVMAIIVPSESVNRYALAELKRFIHEARRTHAVLLHVDDESSIKASARVCAFEIGSLIMRVVSTASSQGEGIVQRFHQTLFAQARAIWISVASRLGVCQEKCQVDHPPSPGWPSTPLGSSASLYTTMGSAHSTDGVGKGPLPSLAEFGEQVSFKAHASTSPRTPIRCAIPASGPDQTRIPQSTLS